MKATMPTGTLTKKIHGHEKYWVSAPPRTRPIAAPPIAIAAQTPSALARSAPSLKVVEMIESAAGEINARAEALECAEGDQHPFALREPVHQRGEREDHEPDQEDPLAPEQVAGAAAEEQEAAEDERVGSDDPLEAGFAQVEILLDRRQGDVHDRAVEDDHELREADQDQDDPRICLFSWHELCSLSRTGRRSPLNVSEPDF